MIKNLIFDMGNVLLRFEPYRYVEELNIMDAKEREMLFNAVYVNKRCPLLDKGEYDETRFVEEVSAELPKKYKPMVEKLIFHWADEVRPVPGMADFIKECKEKGYKIYLLSNAGYRQHEYWTRIPGHEYFDGTIVSCDYNTLKPEKKMYKALYDTYKLKPKECFFIDDLPINIYGASMTGMDGFVFHGDIDELRKEFIRKGIFEK